MRWPTLIWGAVLGSGAVLVSAAFGASVPLNWTHAAAHMESVLFPYGAWGGHSAHNDTFADPVLYPGVQVGVAWTDASGTITTTASTPVAAVASRIGIHIWNLGAYPVCLNYASTAAVSGASCASGSFPIAAGGAYFEDQPANVSPQALSLIAVGGSSVVTIKVR